MFASKTPRDLNRDPEPWISSEGWRWDSNPIGDNFWEPRPEFDHVQHNAPNPILVEFRTSGDAAFDWWHWLGSTYDRTTPPWQVAFTERHRDHARHVLSRLARLAEVSNA